MFIIYGPLVVKERGRMSRTKLSISFQLKFHQEM